MLPCGIEASPCLLIHGAAVHHAAVNSEADWIRRIGVCVAVAGVLVAAPDGAAWAWRQAKDLFVVIWRQLAHKGEIAPKSHADFGAITEHVSVQKRIEWNVHASTEDKVELLHQQVELQAQEISGLRLELHNAKSELGKEIADVAATARDRHKEIAVRIELQEKFAARTDARGICLIGLGVVLTGIPDGLAAFGFWGWLAVAVALALGTWLSMAVIFDFRRSGR